MIQLFNTVVYVCVYSQTCFKPVIYNEFLEFSFFQSNLRTLVTVPVKNNMIKHLLSSLLTIRSRRWHFNYDWEYVKNIHVIWEEFFLRRQCPLAKRFYKSVRSCRLVPPSDYFPVTYHGKHFQSCVGWISLSPLPLGIHVYKRLQLNMKIFLNCYDDINAIFTPPKLIIAFLTVTKNVNVRICLAKR